MFDRDYTFRGKYARYVKDLVEVANLFDRNLDLYILAPVIGFLYGRKCLGQDASSGELTTKIFTEQMLKEGSILKQIYRIIIMLDESEKVENSEKRLDRAFRTDADKEAVQQNMQIFDAYVLGGVEYLHERLFENRYNNNEYIDGLYEFIDEFNQDLMNRTDIEDMSAIIAQYS